MNQALDFIFDMFSTFVNFLDTTIFSMFGVNVSIWAILLGGWFIIFSVSVFWKGAKG